MAIRIDLGGGDWSFAGFHGEDWRFRQAYKPETGVKYWLPATVPGSVHWDLLKAGEIPDPYFERNSRLVEWVHQRQWVYKRNFTVPAEWNDLRLSLHFEGIDYESEIYLDGELLGTHNSMFLPATFEITAKAIPGATHHLAVVIKDAPREWPQLGHTSEVRTAKARFGYWWDFATRLVHLGIWQNVWLEGTGPVRIQDVHVRPRGPEAEVTVQLEGAARTEIRLLDPHGNLVGEFTSGGASRIIKQFVVPDAQLWWPNGLGEQPIYRCAVRISGPDEQTFDTREVTFGFRRFELKHNPWPYTFTVNGHRLFVKGWNWVPIDHMYGRPDLSERYEQLIALARAAGVNLLRVWGGGLLERKLFYDLCDRAGIMVWQEFCQSASGTDNVPPSDPAYLARLEREARGAVLLRRNHPSLVLWCGGNELTDWEKRPATLDEPALAMLANVVEELGAVARSSLDRFMAPAHQWPPDETNPNWVHHGAWSMQEHRVRELFGAGAGEIGRYLALSQYLQAENLRYGVESNRRRWPECSGAIIWQLNEPWPNSHCTSAVDYYLRPKMAYYYVKKAYAPVACSLRYDGPIAQDGLINAKAYVVADQPFSGMLRATVTDPTGRLWHQEDHEVSVHGAAEVAVIGYSIPPEAPDVAIVTLTLGGFSNSYLFSKAGQSIFESLLSLPQAHLHARRAGDALILRNDGPGYALFPMVDIDDPRWHWMLSDNAPLLAPGEETAITVSLRIRRQRSDTDHPHGREAEGPLRLNVTGWNTAPLTLTWEV